MGGTPMRPATLMACASLLLASACAEPVENPRTFNNPIPTDVWETIRLCRDDIQVCQGGFVVEEDGDIYQIDPAYSRIQGSYYIQMFNLTEVHYGNTCHGPEYCPRFRNAIEIVVESLHRERWEQLAILHAERSLHEPPE